MAKTGKVTAQTQYGVFTRKTNRPYTHAVIAVGKSEAWLEQSHAKHVGWNRKERAQYQAVVDNPAFTEDHKTRYRGWIAGLDEQLQMMATQLGENLDWTRKAKAEGTGTCLSWHMSLSAALKAVSQWQAEGWQMVQIVPVTERVEGGR